MGHSTDSQMYAYNWFSEQTMPDCELENGDRDSIIGYSLDYGNLRPIDYLNQKIWLFLTINQ